MRVSVMRQVEADAAQMDGEPSIEIIEEKTGVGWGWGDDLPLPL